MSVPPQAIVPVLAPWRPAFEVKVTHDRADTICVTAVGDLDVSTIGDLREAVIGVMPDPWQHLILDLRELTFADSSVVHLARDAFAGTIAGARDFTLLPGGSARRVLRLASDVAGPYPPGTLTR